MRERIVLANWAENYDFTNYSRAFVGHNRQIVTS